jgi:benzoyl-CoA 2,3-dioxygenase component B
VIDLPTIQRYLNFHYSVTIDLFGSDLSSNAATFYGTGLKGRYQEERLNDDHQLVAAKYNVLDVRDGKFGTREAPALNSLNERLRDDFIADSIAGVQAWNKSIQKYGVDFALVVPHKAFNRRIGPLAEVRVSPTGKIVTEAEWNANVRGWLATDEDRAFVQSLMGRVVEPGQFANYIMPPTSGINSQPVEAEYVRFA